MSVGSATPRQLPAASAPALPTRLGPAGPGPASRSAHPTTRPPPRVQVHALGPGWPGPCCHSGVQPSRICLSSGLCTLFPVLGDTIPLSCRRAAWNQLSRFSGGCPSLSKASLPLILSFPPGGLQRLARLRACCLLGLCPDLRANWLEKNKWQLVGGEPRPLAEGAPGLYRPSHLSPVFTSQH